MRTMVLFLLLALPSLAAAHDDPVDKQGGHTGADGTYHCHTAGCAAATGAPNERSLPPTTAVPASAKGKHKNAVKPAKAKAEPEKKDDGKK